MSLKSNNKTEVNTIELEIEVSAADFEAAVQSAYLKARNKISVPGFRKGKAPRKMIEKLYGEGTFFEDAVNSLIPVETQKVIDEEKIKLVDAPKYDVTSVNKETGVVYKAVCTVHPEVKVSNYKGIEAEKVVKDVTDEEIDAKINQMREKGSRMITVDDRACQTGDSVVIDFDGFVDGVPFDGGKAEDFTLALGSGQFIPGFEDQVAGHSIDEEFDVNVTFPEDYQMKEIAGKPAVFKVKLHEIKVKELPELDDDFVKDTSEFDTVAELKEDIKNKLIEQYKKQAETDTENKIFDTVIANTEVEIPQVMIENRISQMVEEAGQTLGAQGINLDLYLQYMGMTIDAFRKSFEERAKKEVTLRLALEEIAKLENITASDEDVENGYQILADRYKVTPEQVKMAIPEYSIREDALAQNVAKFITGSAVIK